MPLYFLDTSALVKLYFAEAGSPAMAHLAGTPGAQLAISTLAVVEFRAVVRKQQRSRVLDAGSAGAILEHFSEKSATGLIRQILNDTVLDITLLLLDRHPLRAPDALHLAACIVLGQTLGAAAPIFTCSDHALLRAAQQEGLPCWNPEAALPG